MKDEAPEVSRLEMGLEVPNYVMSEVEREREIEVQVDGGNVMVGGGERRDNPLAAGYPLVLSESHCLPVSYITAVLIMSTLRQKCENFSCNALLRIAFLLNSLSFFLKQSH